MSKSHSKSGKVGSLREWLKPQDISESTSVAQVPLNRYTPKDIHRIRVDNSDTIFSLTNQLEPCIQASTAFQDNLTIIDKDGKEVISFIKKIGTASAFGEAYLTTLTGRYEQLSIKIMDINMPHYLEVQLLMKMATLVRLGITPNMPLLHNVLECRKTSRTTIPSSKATIRMLTQNYYVILNEIANGDLHDFFKEVRSEIEYESILFQIIFALQAFHQLGYKHNDTHLGNFLWHQIVPGGYWQYEYKGTKFYVPNAGHLIVLWDPGLAKPIRRNRFMIQDINSDFTNPIGLIYKIEGKSFYKQQNMKGIPMQNLLIDVIYEKMYLWLNQGLQSTSMRFMDYILHLMKNGDLGVSHIRITPPDNDYIINDTPYPLEFTISPPTASTPIVPTPPPAPVQAPPAPPPPAPVQVAPPAPKPRAIRPSLSNIGEGALDRWRRATADVGLRRPTNK